MTELASMLIGTVLLFIVFVQIREANELTRTKYRFRYFALRDKLAMLVAKGELAEASWEYQHIVQTLNFHISAVESLSLFRIADVLANYHLSSAEERQVNMISKKLDNKEVAAIVVGYMDTTYELIRRNSRVQIAIVRAMDALGHWRKDASSSRPESLAEMPNRALSTIRTHQSVVGSAVALA